MARNKMKQKIAAVLAAVLVLQGMPISVLATETETVQQEVVQDIKGEAASQKATGVNVAYHTQDEIRNYIAQSGAKITDNVTFQKNPKTEAPYELGKLSDETLDSAIRMLNQIRYIAGVSYDVTLDDSYNEMAQAASLVNYVNGKMTHDPEQPNGMSKEMYELAKEGAGSSNIAWGSGTSWKLNYFLVMSWMEDGDAFNIDRVGHRRWLINPSMKKTGFGLVNGTKGTHSAVYAFDGVFGSADEYGVMWPAQNMPIDYFNAIFPWSISMGTEVDASAVNVTLTRKSDGKVWKFSQSSADGDFYVNNDYYGQPGCIIFRPTGVDAYKAGDCYDVNISGLSKGDVSYTVNFFDLAANGEVESVSISPDTASVEVGKKQQFKGDIVVKDGAETTVTWSVKGNKSKSTTISETGLLTVAKDETAASLTVRVTSKADATKYAEATVNILRPAVPKKGKAFTVGDLKYKVTKSASKNGTVTVTAPKNKNVKTISIPSTVKINGYTFKVTAIADKAFKNNKNLKKATIGNNVTFIGASAFEGDKKLTSVTIGKGVTKIGSKAFNGDKKLTTIKINTTKLKTVKSGAFKGIPANAKVKVPKGKAKAYQNLLKKGGLPAKVNVK